MTIHRKKRNWSQYNQKLKKIASINFFISEEAISNWYYSGKRQHGGKVIYSEYVIELCLLMREFYQLPYRQAQGFVESVLKSMKLELKIPDYTTVSRRASKLNVVLGNKELVKTKKESIVV